MSSTFPEQEHLGTAAPCAPAAEAHATESAPSAHTLEVEPSAEGAVSGDAAATAAIASVTADAPTAEAQAPSSEAEAAADSSAPTDTDTASEAAAAVAATTQGQKRADDLAPAACAAKLAELFPALFAPVPDEQAAPVKPIKLRIHADIQARAPGVFTKRVLGIFFSRWTTTTPYLKALAQAPHRFDLDGQPAGDIADEHRQAAVQELERRRSIAIERRAMQRRATQPPSRRDSAPSDAPHVDAAPGNHDEAAAQRPQQRPQQQRPQQQRPRRPQGPGSEQHHAHDTRQRDERRGPQPPHGQPMAGRSSALGQQTEGPRPAQRANDRFDRGHPGERDPRAGPRGPRPDTRQHDQGQRRDDRHDRHQAPREPALPLDPAQRDRAQLLRAYEGSTLTKANFCALKRMSQADLDAQLALAQQERAAARSAAS